MFPFRITRKRQAFPRFKTPEEVATELNITREKQLAFDRQNRPNDSALQKARFEALLWVLGESYATSVVR